MKALRWIAPPITVLALAGCGIKAERNNLRNCRFSPVSMSQLAPNGDSLRFSVRVEVANPTSEPAALDSFRLVASTNSPVALLSHGSTRKVGPGGQDTVDLHVSITRTAVATSLLQMAFAPPDSLSIEGDVWVPGVLWGSNRHPLRARFPLAPHLGKLKELLGKGMKP